LKVLPKEQLPMFSLKSFSFKSLNTAIALSSIALLLSYSATVSATTLETSKTLKPSVQLSGKIEQGALVLGKTAVNNQVSFDGKVLPLTKQGNFVFGFSRDDNEKHQLLIVNTKGKRLLKILKPKKRDYKIQRITGIAKKIMQPNPKAIAHIKKDNQQIKKARAVKSNLTAFAQGFIAPNSGQITGVYGSQRYFNGKPKRPHFGLDFAAPKGAPVIAPADGVVTLFVPDMFYSGGTLLIDHGHGINSTFLHLSKSYVKKGDTVKKGQKIAEVGRSGRATGPHLDWRVNWYKVRLDPALVLKVKPILNN